MINDKESEVIIISSCIEECFEFQEVINCKENKLSILVSQIELLKEFDNYVEIEINFFVKCSGDFCLCIDSYKFWQYLVGILFSDKNFIFFYKCFFNGDVMWKGDFFQDQEGNFFDDIIVLNEEFIFGIIMLIEDEIFFDCFRFFLFCKMVCYRLVLMLLMSIIYEFIELEKKDNIRFECQFC